MNTHEDNELSEAIKARASYHEAPPVLREGILAALGQMETRAPAKTHSPLMWSWMRLGLAFACGVLVSLGLLRFHDTASGHDQLLQEVVASHVRSLMVAHLADIPSSEQHVVKPWFSGKLDFSPPVNDLAAEGFPLIGGRLDYIGRRAVAALVYSHQKHIINLFVWPLAEDSSRNSTEMSLQGFNVIEWSASGMHFSAVSDLNAKELADFAALLRKKSAS